MQKTPETVQAENIAAAFVKLLREALTEEQWISMRAKNATPDYAGDVCASHDYCDANDPMADAFESVVGRPVDGDNAADCRLWGEAWAIAKASDLTARNFELEFPDYPAADMPVMPEGFEDVSWHNDTCPSFLNEDEGLIIFADYADVQKRETQEPYPRFTIGVWDNGSTGETVAESNDFADIIAAIADRAAD